MWLPLPHLVNMFPVQIDYLYRTGGFAIALSVLCHASCRGGDRGDRAAAHGIARRATLAAAIYATNPNVLYLQSTPMTEPMLFGLTTLQVCLVHASGFWTRRLTLASRCRVGHGLRLPHALRGVADHRSRCSRRRRSRGGGAARACADVMRVHATAWRCTRWRPSSPSWSSAGSPSASGSSAAASSYRMRRCKGQPAVVFDKIAEGVAIARRRLARSHGATGHPWSWRLLGFASAGRAPMLVPLSLFARPPHCPSTAYLAGHPFRMRYEIPLDRRVSDGRRAWRRPAARLGDESSRSLSFVAVVSRTTACRCARRNGGRSAARSQRASDAAQVTACLKTRLSRRDDHGSMGALGHYMHELSAAGFAIRDFLHEGNGPIWDSAFTRGPARAGRMGARRGGRGRRRRHHPATTRDSATARGLRTGLRGW